MANKEWLKNLASMAMNRASSLQPATIAATQAITSQKIQTELHALYQEATEACEIFNSYVGKDKTIRILNLETPDGQQTGFILLLRRAQLRLQRVELHLEASLTTFHAFNTSTQLLYRVEPRIGDGDSWRWQIDGKDQVNNEVLIRQLLQTIYEATLSESATKKIED